MTVPNLRRSWARALFLAALLLYLAPQAVAAIVTGTNQPRRAFDGSGGYTYTRILEALTGAGAIDTLVTDGSGHLVVSTTGTGAISGTVTANQGTGGSSAWKVDGSTVTQPVSGTITQGTAGASAWLTSDSAATTASATLQSAATGTGNGTVLSTAGMGAVAFTVSITGGTAAITWEAQEDGSTWFPFSVMGATSPPLQGTTTISGFYLANVAGYQQVRARISAISGATVTVTGHASPTAHPPRSIALGQQQAVVDTNNSSTATLTSGSTFTGTATDLLNYAGGSVNVIADQASAISGLKIEQSSDGTNWDLVADVYTISASTGFSVPFTRVSRYFRVVYVNGSTNQGAFRLQTLLTPVASALPRTLDLSGRLQVGITSGGSPPTQVTLGNPSADNSTLGIGIPVYANLGLWNGAGWDKYRDNTDSSLLASSARTAATNSADQTNYNGRGVKCVISVTAASGTGGLTIGVQGKDSVSGSYYTLLSSAALTGTGVTVLTVYPGVTAAANASLSDAIPRTWRVSVTVGDASSYTYSVSGVTIN